MSDGVGKLAKRTGQKFVDVKPPHAVHVAFPEEEFDQLTKVSDGVSRLGFGFRV
jgi:hypothetical protein